MESFYFFYSEYVDYTKGVKAFLSSIKFDIGQEISVNGASFKIIDKVFIKFSTNNKPNCYRCSAIEAVKNSEDYKRVYHELYNIPIKTVLSELGIVNHSVFMRSIFKDPHYIKGEACVFYMKYKIIPV